MTPYQRSLEREIFLLKLLMQIYERRHERPNPV